MRRDPFPFEAVRDLLGLLRAFYAATKSDGRNPRRAALITQVASELKAAARLALEHEPGTLGYAAAWRRAEDATRRACDLVDAITAFEPIVRAAGERVTGAGRARTRIKPLPR